MLRLVGVILISSFTYAKIRIDKIEACEATAVYDITITQKIKDENGMQVIEEGSLDSKIDLDDNIMGFVEIFIFEEGKWNFFITFEGTVCEIVNKYFAGITEELEKAAGLTKSCPYPAGGYKVTNIPLDFEQVDHAIVPRGRLKLKMTFSNLKTEKIVGCQTGEFTITD